MRRPPPITRFASFPATAGVALLAIAASLVYFTHADSVARLTLDARAFHGEPWRLVTSTLLHGDILHLAFNAYWLWVFGTALEEHFGHFPLFLAMAICGATSSAAEYAFFGGSIGLSGVGYGLFGASWVLSRRVPHLRDLVDAATVQMFVLWGLFCIVTTVTKLLPVANVAHAMGLLVGVTVGLAASRSRLWWLATVALVAATGLAATAGRHFINLDRDRAAHELAYAAQELDRAGRSQASIALYEEALRFDAKPAYQANLGDVYRRSDRLVDARTYYSVACGGGESSGCGSLAIMMESGMGGAADLASAVALYRKACDARDASSCANLGRFYEAGSVVDRDLDRARELYRIGCNAGLQSVCDQLRKLPPP